jgi:hypothetical protein
MDEVAQWKNKAAALHEYGRQAKDKTLLQLAFKIKVRAMRRAGELAEAFRSQGARNDLTSDGVIRGSQQALIDAGFNKNEALHTIPVLASASEEKFETIIEAEDTPTNVRDVLKLVKTEPLDNKPRKPRKTQYDKAKENSERIKSRPYHKLADEINRLSSHIYLDMIPIQEQLESAVAIQRKVGELVQMLTREINNAWGIDAIEVKEENGLTA